MNDFCRLAARRVIVASAAAALSALAMGVPTGVVPTPFYSRMTPVRWWDYAIWAVSATLVGLLATSYVVSGRAGSSATGRAVSGGVLATLAIGCPICNKLVVALIGVSGALDLWAPIQPFLGLASLALLGAALAVRLRAGRSCAALSASHTPAS